MGVIPARRPVPFPPVTYLLIPVIGAVSTHQTPASSDRLMASIRQHFDEPTEHVAVLYKGHRRDMFVGETSAINDRHIRNVRATEIYRNNWLTRHPGTDPESLPAISGPAVLFPDDIVWR